MGIRVDFWTINDPAEARRLLELGADGIMTDDPAAIAPVFDRYKN
jgi:glycerophosphoryl diester phosphodiesterase